MICKFYTEEGILVTTNGDAPAAGTEIIVHDNRGPGSGKRKRYRVKSVNRVVNINNYAIENIPHKETDTGAERFTECVRYVEADTNGKYNTMDLDNRTVVYSTDECEVVVEEISE